MLTISIFDMNVLSCCLNSQSFLKIYLFDSTDPQTPENILKEGKSDSVIYQTIIHSAESARKFVLADVICYWKMTSFMALDGVMSFLRLKDVAKTCKRMQCSLGIGMSSSVQWWKVGRS